MMRFRTFLNTCRKSPFFERTRHEIIGTGLRVYFPALKSALINQPKEPKGQSAKTDGTLDDTMPGYKKSILKRL